tara:strand:+ start:946 stop:1125 length:180 start_codon:yes stop_codon:yes gene_type:complete
MKGVIINEAFLCKQAYPRESNWTEFVVKLASNVNLTTISNRGYAKPLIHQLSLSLEHVN